MAIIHKKSAVPGKIPATTDLALGQLGVNTYDGRAYLKVNKGSGDVVMDIGSEDVHTYYLNPTTTGLGITPNYTTADSTTVQSVVGNDGEWCKTLDEGRWYLCIGGGWQDYGIINLSQAPYLAGSNGESIIYVNDSQNSGNNDVCGIQLPYNENIPAHLALMTKVKHIEIRTGRNINSTFILGSFTGCDSTNFGLSTNYHIINRRYSTKYVFFGRQVTGVWQDQNWCPIEGVGLITRYAPDPCGDGCGNGADSTPTGVLRYTLSGAEYSALGPIIAAGPATGSSPDLSGYSPIGGPGSGGDFTIHNLSSNVVTATSVSASAAVNATSYNGLYVGNRGSSNWNSAVGQDSLVWLTTGQKNAALGYQSLVTLTTGVGNVGIGYIAGSSITTSYLNTAIGTEALRRCVDGGYNTAIGAASLAYNVSSNFNTGLGYMTLLNTTSDGNTAVGSYALSYNTSGNYSVAIGHQALIYMTTSSNNTAVGYNSLSTFGVTYSNCGAFGSNAQVTGSNQIQLGDGSTTTYVYGTVQNRSDLRDKTDVRDTVLGLDFISALRPVDYKWDLREDYKTAQPVKPAELRVDATDVEKAAHAELVAKYDTDIIVWADAVKLGNITHDGTKKRNRYHHGLIAQEVKATIEASGVDFGGFQDHSKNGGDDVLSIGYDELIAPMIKAIQELTARIKVLESK